MELERSKDQGARVELAYHEMDIHNPRSRRATYYSSGEFLCASKQWARRSQWSIDRQSERSMAPDTYQFTRGIVHRQRAPAGGCAARGDVAGGAGPQDSVRPPDACDGLHVPPRKLSERTWTWGDAWSLLGFHDASAAYHLLEHDCLTRPFHLNSQSVREEYLTYQAWDTVQALCSYLRGILTTKAILEGSGVGSGK